MQGDEHAFASIVDGSIDRLYAIATLITRDRSLAEDAVQEALVRAWRDLPKLREPQRVSAWLARLTVNATYDVLRRRRRVRDLRPLDEMSAIVSDAASSVVDRLVLSEAYGRLSPEQRAVIVLHYYQGIPLDEVAATLGIPAGTVRSRLNAALSSMRRWLGPSATGVAGVARQEVTA